MMVRGVRGATTVAVNDAEAMLEATRDLLLAVVEANGIDPEDVGAVYFTVTPDLDAAFPAAAARQIGWSQVPLLDACEVPVPGSLSRCIRVLVLWNTEVGQDRVVHIYLRGAAALRPDLTIANDRSDGGKR
jgi:chorismate mutase